MKNPTICGIVAAGPYDVIGKNGIMPWYSRVDFFHFRSLTTPHPCIFGKNTFEKLPNGPLPNRLNVVCSSGYKNEMLNGVFYAKSLENAIKYCENFDYIFICGGGQIYKYAIDKDLIDIMYLTKIYDKDLAVRIVQNPNKYVKFPINTNEFFDSNKWINKRMLYNENILPKEKTGITTKFFKCVRVR